MLHVHPSWKDADLRGIRAAWYQREITVPKDWAGRRIALSVEYLNSFAIVYVDGKKAGELRFPWDGVDLTATCQPGGKHVLSLFVMAMSLKDVLLSYTDTNSAKEVNRAESSATRLSRGTCICTRSRQSDSGWAQRSAPRRMMTRSPCLTRRRQR